MSKRTKKHLDHETMWTAAMKPLMDYCRRTHGGKAQVERKWAELTGNQPPRVTFMRWLHPDEERRSEPSLGNGLILIRIGELLIADEGKAKK